VGRGGGRVRRGDQRAHAPGRAPTTSKGVWPAFGFTRNGTSPGGPGGGRAQITSAYSRLVAVGEVGLPWYGLGAVTDPRGGSPAGPRAPRAPDRISRSATISRSSAPRPTARRRRAGRAQRRTSSARCSTGKASAEVTRAIVDAGLSGVGHPGSRLPTGPRDWSSRCDRVAAGGERRPWPYQGSSRTSLGPRGSSRGSRKRWAKIKRLPAEEATSSSPVNTCRLFDLVWA